MTEINLDVDFPHPAERVWRALTDPRLVEEWFALNDLVSEAGTRGHFWPAGMAGLTGPIDVEMVDITPQQQIKMVWQADQLHTRVSWALSEIPGGTRLSIAQIGFLGTQGTARRRTLRATYEQVFRENLGAVLDRLAAGVGEDGAGHIDLRAAMPREGRSRKIAHHAAIVDVATAPTGAVPTVVTASGESPWGTDQPEAETSPHRRRLIAILSAVGVAMMLALGFLITLGGPSAGDAADNGLAGDPGGAAVPGDIGGSAGGSMAPGMTGGPGVPAGTPGPGQSGGVQPTVTTSVSNGVTVTVTVIPSTSSSTNEVIPPASPSTTTTTPQAPVGPLTANYRTTDAFLGGYTGEITVRNVTAADFDDWTVVITLPPLAIVTRASEADYDQAGDTVTFRGQPTNEDLGAGASITFGFQVGVDVLGTAPLSCKVGNTDCTGL